MISLRISFPIIGAAVLGACTPVSEEQPTDGAKATDSAQADLNFDPAQNCLLMVWSEQDEPDVDFDRENDAVKGGAISCATGTSPSQFEAAISALRDAARSGDRARILEQIGIPLLYIDANGEPRELSEEQLDELFDEIFDANMLELLQRLDLRDMTVETEQGAFFELGSLWLVVDQDGTPRVMTVNRQALGEAAAAARDKAITGQGRELD